MRFVCMNSKVTRNNIKENSNTRIIYRRSKRHRYNPSYLWTSSKLGLTIEFYYI